MNNNTFSETKQCTKCKKTYPRTAEYFNRNKNTKDGLRTMCKECMKEYRINNKEKIRAKQKEWEEKNREHLKQYYKEYADNNAEKLKEYYKEYHQENRDKRNKQSNERYYKNYDEISEYHRKRAADPEFKKKRRKYRQSRKERDRILHNQWRKDNKERVSTLKQRRYNKKRGLPADLTHEQWLEICNDFDNKCAYCGMDKELTRDHFIPITKNGEFTKNNIIPACRSCNSSKGNTDFFEWYPIHERYSKQRERKILEYLNYESNKTQQLALL